MKRMKYICYYDRLDSKIKRNYVLSATNKIDYIVSVLNRIGYGVDLVSLSECTEKNFVFSLSKVYFNNANSLRLFFSFGLFQISFLRWLSRFLLRVQFIIWFIFNVKKGEEVLVYHSLGYCKLLLFLQKITKCSYIGEIEEIYQDVSKMRDSVCKAEYKFIYSCKKYLFPTQLLSEKINSADKPHVIIHGIYMPEESFNVSFCDNDVHVVYAGTLDPNKGGANAAILSANYLPSNFHLHILGFGSSNTVKNIMELIGKVAQTAPAKITFEGLLKGKDFSRFLQKCHIGLSTQDPHANFNNTSFPSKILTYLANGLKVVSIKIPVVENSFIGKCITYYNVQSPEDIARAIVLSSQKTDETVKNVLLELDIRFINDLKELLAIG